jgi:hypothetical protein
MVDEALEGPAATCAGPCRPAQGGIKQSHNAPIVRPAVTNRPGQDQNVT